MNIVITGASAGIGYQASLYLASLGHNVFAVARRKENLDKLFHESVQKNTRGKIYPSAGNISDEKFLDELFNEIKRNVGTIHILINNAGTLVNKSFEELSDQDWKE